MTIEECAEEETGILEAIRELGTGFLGTEIIERASSSDSNYLFCKGRVLKGDDRLNHFQIPPEFDIGRLNGPMILLNREDYAVMRYSFYKMPKIKHVLDPNLHWQWTTSPNEIVDLNRLESSNNPDYPDWFIIKKD